MPNVESNETRGRARRAGGVVLTAAGGVVAALAGLGLLTSVIERKHEAETPFYRVVELTDTTVDPAV